MWVTVPYFCDFRFVSVFFEDEQIRGRIRRTRPAAPPGDRHRSASVLSMLSMLSDEMSAITLPGGGLSPAYIEKRYPSYTSANDSAESVSV